MEVDNFDLLRDTLIFDSDDEFYFVQATIRKKDGVKNTPEGRSLNGDNKNRMIKFWTIRSREELDKVKPDIINICKTTGARAYIHPTPRSFKSVAGECLKLCTEDFVTENYQGLKGAYSSACGTSYIHSKKKWILDYDSKDIKTLHEMKLFINKECQPFGISKWCYRVPTPHGFHLLCTPFDSKTFSDKYPDVTIHKNNPTLLYFISNETDNYNSKINEIL